MSARPLRLEEFMLLFSILYSICCTSNSTISCSSYNGTDYIGKDVVENDITFGDCSFEQTLCNYTQGCKDDDSNSWTVSQGDAVCPGRDTGLYDSFSVLLSPLLSITQNTSIVFSYYQRLPGKLSVFLATKTGITEVYSEEESDGSFKHVVYIENSTVAKVGFKARKASAGSNVRLSYVKFKADPRFTRTPARVTVTRTSAIPNRSVVSSSTQTAQVPEIGTSSTPDQSTPVVSTESGTSSTPDQTVAIVSNESVMPVAEKQDGGSNVGVIVGVLIAVVAVIVAGVLAGIFILRLRNKRQNCSDGQTAVKDKQNVYRSADPRLEDEAAIESSYKNTHNVLDISVYQYNIPRLPEVASPSAADEEPFYHILEEPNITDKSQTQCIYSFARSEGVNSSNADNSEGNYNRTESPGVIPHWQGESRSGPVEDYYNYTASADKSREEVAGRREATQGMASGRHDSDCVVNTSRDDEDGYSVLCAGNKQSIGFNDQKNKSAKAYDHVTGNLHEDYDRIRQGDRNIVIGSDYDHVM